MPYSNKFSVGMVQRTPGGNKGEFVLVVATERGLVQFVKDNSKEPAVWFGPYMLYPGNWHGVSIFQDRDASFQFAAVQSMGWDKGKLFWFRNQALYPPGTEQPGGPRLSPEPILIQDNNCFGTPAIIESDSGSVLQMVVPGEGESDMQHFTWENNVWTKTAEFGRSLRVLGVSMIKSFFGHLELVAVQWNESAFGDLVHYFYNFQDQQWHKTKVLGTYFQGSPAIIQSDIGKNGNFEVVVARRDGGLTHFARNNDSSPFPWYPPVNFGNTMNYTAVSLIESNVSTPGELYVAAIRGHDTVDIYRRAPAPTYTWSGPIIVN